jgi:hypothetical protein
VGVWACGVCQPKLKSHAAKIKMITRGFSNGESAHHGKKLTKVRFCGSTLALSSGESTPPTTGHVYTKKTTNLKPLGLKSLSASLSESLYSDFFNHNEPMQEYESTSSLFFFESINPVV